jgi:hypothetical protein
VIVGLGFGGSGKVLRGTAKPEIEEEMKKMGD